jgi:segregation and condensation protein A
VFASSFAAALELVREGEAEVHQKEAFAPIFVRKRRPDLAAELVAPETPAS